MQARRKVFAIGAANYGEGGSERGLSSRALIRPPEKIPLQTSGGGTFWGYFELYIRTILALLYGFLHAWFSLQINPIMNVIMMMPTKTLAPKIIHKHNFCGCDTWPLPRGAHYTRYKIQESLFTVEL